MSEAVDQIGAERFSADALNGGLPAFEAMLRNEAQPGRGFSA